MRNSEKEAIADKVLQTSYHKELELEFTTFRGMSLP